MNSTMAQPRREAKAARGGLSHLLDNFEDLRRSSSPSGLSPRFFVEFWVDGCSELNKVRAIYKLRKPLVEVEAKPPRKRAGLAGPMGLGRPAYPVSGSPRSHFSRADSSHLLEFMSFTIAPLLTSLSWRYLRGKDRIGNPSLNLNLLCLIPKYLDLIIVGLVLWALLEDGCA